MKNLTIRAAANDTTFTARDFFHAAAIVKEHHEATNAPMTYFVLEGETKLLGWFTTSKSTTKWNAAK